VQSQSDADLTQVIAKGKNKMPAYEKSLKPDEIKGLVAYLHELEKK
jgi:mono/diheme cytochrome c family protein